MTPLAWTAVAAVIALVLYVAGYGHGYRDATAVEKAVKRMQEQRRWAIKPDSWGPWGPYDG